MHSKRWRCSPHNGASTRVRAAADGNPRRALPAARASDEARASAREAPVAGPGPPVGHHGGVADTPPPRSVKISDDERGGWSSDRPRREGAPPSLANISVRCRVLKPADRLRYSPGSLLVIACGSASE